MKSQKGCTSKYNNARLDGVRFRYGVPDCVCKCIACLNLLEEDFDRIGGSHMYVVGGNIGSKHIFGNGAIDGPELRYDFKGGGYAEA